MGAKSWMIAYSSDAPRHVLTGRPELDESATDAVVEALFRGASRVGDADLFAVRRFDDRALPGRRPNTSPPPSTGSAIDSAAHDGSSAPAGASPTLQRS